MGAKTGQIHGRDHSPFGSDPHKFAEYEFKLFSDADVLSTGDGRFIWRVPRSITFPSLALVYVNIYVSTVSSSGLPTFQLRNLGTGNDVLTTAATIDVSDYDSDDATTPPVIDPAEAVFSAGDLIRFDIDVAGTGAKGLGGTLRFG